jgi:methylenetetrahydrofolate reductase (NADPH)
MKTNSNLKKLLEKGEFIIISEIGLPISINIDPLKKNIEKIKGKANAVIASDGKNAGVHISNLAAAILLQQYNIEPILEISCRDRNRIAIQSEVLGAASLGINNILCTAGDHQKLGPFPHTKHCYDIDSTQEILMLKQLRDEKKLSNGQELDESPSIFIGTEDNPFSDPLELRIILIKKKIESGADFIITRPVFDVSKFSEWIKALESNGVIENVPLIVSVLPLKSKEMAHEIKERPGYYLPDTILNQIEKASDAQAEGIKIAKDIINKVKGLKGVKGINIIAIDNEDAVAALA